MWPALPASDYYGSSVPSRRHQPAKGLPAGQQAAGRGGGCRDGSHVHSRTVRRGRRPALLLRHRHGYAAGFHRGLPTGETHQPRSSPHDSIDVVRVRVATQPRSVRFELVDYLRSVQPLVPHVHLPVLLAGPRPSDGASPSRRCQGCLPPSPSSQRSGCPQLHRAAATTRRRCPFITARSKSASWRSVSRIQKARDRLSRSRSIRSWAFSARRLDQIGPIIGREPLAIASLDPLQADPVTQRARIHPDRSTATSAIGRPSSSTIATVSRRNSGGNFEGRPLGVVFFLLDMDHLLYEMSVQRGDARLVALRVSAGCEVGVGPSSVGRRRAGLGLGSCCYTDVGVTTIMPTCELCRDRWWSGPGLGFFGGEVGVIRGLRGRRGAGRGAGCCGWWEQWR